MSPRRAALVKQENGRSALSPAKKDQDASRHQSPSRAKRPGQSRTNSASPVKTQATPSKSRPWDKLWGIEYKMEEGKK